MADTEKVIETRQASNLYCLQRDNASIIVPLGDYDVNADNRYLIPFTISGKVGFLNRMASIIVPAKYDFCLDEFKSESDLVRVGCYVCGKRYNGEPCIERRLGLIDSNGYEVLPVSYRGIAVSDNRQLITISEEDSGYSVIDINKSIIIQKGEYDMINGFTFGYARVKKGNKCGIIDMDGNIVLPIEYDQVWTFYKRTDLQYTTIQKKGEPDDRFYFFTPNHKQPSKPNHLPNDREERHYVEFAGTYAQDYAGFSDEDIYDAFDGDPEAYWNID